MSVLATMLLLAGVFLAVYPYRQLREQAPQELGSEGNAVGINRMDTHGSHNHFSIVAHVAVVSKNHNAPIFGEQDEIG